MTEIHAAPIISFTDRKMGELAVDFGSKSLAIFLDYDSKTDTGHFYFATEINKVITTEAFNAMD